MSEWRLVYAFKKLPMKHKKDMQVKIFKKKLQKCTKLGTDMLLIFNCNCNSRKPRLNVNPKHSRKALN